MKQPRPNVVLIGIDASAVTAELQFRVTSPPQRGEVTAKSSILSIDTAGPMACNWQRPWEAWYLAATLDMRSSPRLRQRGDPYLFSLKQR